MQADKFLGYKYQTILDSSPIHPQEQSILNHHHYNVLLQPLAQIIINEITELTEGGKKTYNWTIQKQKGNWTKVITQTKA